MDRTSISRISKIITISILIITTGIGANAYTYILTGYMGLNPDRANLLLNTIRTELLKYPEFSVLDIISIMGIETNGKNIFGDYGKAIGYFQLHPATIYYVWNYFPELGREKFKGKNIKDLIYFPKLQAQIAIAYLHMLYVRYGSIKEAIIHYNGDIHNTNHYYEKYLKYRDYLIKYVINRNQIKF